MNVDASQSDEQLIGRVLGGDRPAYANLVRRYERQVHAAAWAVLRDHHITQDVTQETFLKAHNRLGELQKPLAFSTWLLTTARRTAIDHARSRKNVVFVPNVPETPDVVAPDEQDAAALMQSVMQLRERERQLILMRYFDELTVADIAARLGSPVGTITKQLSRALARLRTRFKETP